MTFRHGCIGTLFFVFTALMMGCGRDDSYFDVESIADSDASVNLPDVPQAPYRFETPVRLQADGVPIHVESPGYACPTVADVDGDGQLDLVVGQFAGGRMKFYRNLAATGESPEFAAGEWIRSEGEPAMIPGVW